MEDTARRDESIIVVEPALHDDEILYVLPIDEPVFSGYP